MGKLGTEKLNNLLQGTQQVSEEVALKLTQPSTLTHSYLLSFQHHLSKA